MASRRLFPLSFCMLLIQFAAAFVIIPSPAAQKSVISSKATLQVSRKEFILASSLLSTLLLPLSSPNAQAADGQSSSQTPTITLDQFYNALRNQEVESVEFDGAMFERAFVKIGGKEFLIGEGYVQASASLALDKGCTIQHIHTTEHTECREPLIAAHWQESSVSPVGPQAVLSRIKNEIQAGNPVKWSTRLASQFKARKTAAPAVQVPAAPAANPASAGGDASGGVFRLPELRLPAPPKTI